MSKAYFAISFNKYSKSKNKWLDYTLTQEGERVWISNQDGEGGEFDGDKLFDVLDKFFQENY